MRWKKLGQIFNTNDYAQSPQTLVFRDRVRVYYSTRSIDSSGKFLSNIAYVEFDKYFHTILKQSDHEIISLGELGCFDEHGIFPLHIFKDNENLWGYISGISRRASVSVDTAIGLAKSTDNGEHFIRLGPGPILTADINESGMVGDPFVKKFGSVFYMWYIFGTGWHKSKNAHVYEREYKLGMATSKDGISWKKSRKQIIEDILENESQALPTIVCLNDHYHLWFCYRDVFDFRSNKEKSYRLGYASSNDLIKWKRDDSKVGLSRSDEGWDSQMICYPHVFSCDKRTYMLYNGNEFGKYGFGLAILET